MPTFRNISGTWRAVIPWRNIGGTWKSGVLWRNIAGVWKIVAGQVSASVSPPTASGVGSSYPMTSNPVTVTASNGSGSYSYAWTVLNTGGPPIEVVYPGSASTFFRSYLAPGSEASGTATCIVTDTATGQTASVSVPVSLAAF